jgi:alpha-amylase
MDTAFSALQWSYNTNIYEVNTRQYTVEGTFEAFAVSLPRLSDMGVEVLWFMPITPISQEKRIGSLGSYYACSDYQTINSEFGNLDDFKKLVHSAHALGMKVIIDWVADHTGWDHAWTRTHPDYYKKNSQGNFYDSNGWEDVIDLDFTNRALRESMIEAMKYWVSACDIDGFRCDMAMLVPLDFWREARSALDAVKKLFWLAECEEIAYHQVFDATYTWRFLHKMESFWRKETNIAGLDELLSAYSSDFPPSAFRAYFTTNHDENSHSGSEYERLGDSAKAFAVFCCTWNGLPLIYSGQELPNFKRIKFFDKDQIDWTGHNLLHDFYKTLLNLRKRNRALRAGDPKVGTKRILTSANEKVFGFLRVCSENAVLVLLNLSEVDLSFQIMDTDIDGVFEK